MTHIVALLSGCRHNSICARTIIILLVHVKQGKCCIYVVAVILSVTEHVTFINDVINGQKSTIVPIGLNSLLHYWNPIKYIIRKSSSSAAQHCCFRLREMYWTKVTAVKRFWTFMPVCTICILVTSYSLRIIKEGIQAAGANATRKHIEETSLCGMLLLEAGKKADCAFNVSSPSSHH